MSNPVAMSSPSRTECIIANRLVCIQIHARSRFRLRADSSFMISSNADCTGTATNAGSFNEEQDKLRDNTDILHGFGSGIRGWNESGGTTAPPIADNSSNFLGTDRRRIRRINKDVHIGEAILLDDVMLQRGIHTTIMHLFIVTKMRNVQRRSKCQS